jgi:hypothetical protein
VQITASALQIDSRSTLFTVWTLTAGVALAIFSIDSQDMVIRMAGALIRK